MNRRRHVDVEPNTGEVETKVGVDEQSRAAGLGVTAILQDKEKNVLPHKELKSCSPTQRDRVLHVCDGGRKPRVGRGDRVR